MGSDGDATTSGGKLLQSQAAVNPKMWYIGGMFHSNTEAEQSHCQVSRRSHGSGVMQNPKLHCVTEQYLAATKVQIKSTKISSENF